MSAPGPVRADVVVVGSGPNGLAAALRCAEAGREVVVLEAEDTVGGGCRTLPVDEPAWDGLVVDPCSAVHPMAAASPFFRSLDLRALGVDLVRPPVQLGHGLSGRDALVVDGDPDSLAAGLGSADEARRWRSVFGPLYRRWAEVTATALSDQRSVPPPSSVAALGLAAARVHPLPGRPDALGPAGRTVFSGIASHAIGPLGSPAATGIGLVLGTLLHAPDGWPIPVGGSGAITAALVRRITELGGTVRTGHRVGSVAGIEARDVVFDTSSRVLGRVLLDSAPSPATARRARRLCRAPVGGAASRVDLVLSGPVPWADPRLAGAGTVHLGGDAAALAAAEREVSRGGHADRPVVLVSQPWVADPGRVAPDGRRPLWTYAHVPAWSTRDSTADVLDALERVAPGVRDVVVAARATPAARLPLHNANYTGGDIAAGRVDLAGLVARPVPRLDPYRVAPGLWQASASTPPGPGVHGMAGEHVARRVLTP